MRPAIIFPTLAAAALILSGCEDKPVYVDRAWVRLNANAEAPAAGYFTVNGGSSAVTLRAVTTEGAVRLEMHDNVMTDGVMKMTPLENVEIPAGKKVTFEPGGKHLMLWTINPAIIAQGKITLTFVFSNGDRILVDAPITPAAGAAPQSPAGEEMHGQTGNQAHPAGNSASH